MEDTLVMNMRKQAASKPVFVLVVGADERTALAVDVLNRLGDIKALQVTKKEDLEEVAAVSRLEQSFLERAASKGKMFTVADIGLLELAGEAVAQGHADLLVGGSDVPTSVVVRAALRTVGVLSGERVTSTFLMETALGSFTFGDCAVVPEPTAEELVSTARVAAGSHQVLTGEIPRVAFLSYSTHGSAEHPALARVKEAALLFKKEYPSILSGGELQLDAAIIPAVGERKAPGSAVAGKANVLIFPDLNAGNIGYKLVERFGQARAIGPLLHGLRAPIADLSRGCSVDDIVDTVCATILLR